MSFLDSPTTLVFQSPSSAASSSNYNSSLIPSSPSSSSLYHHHHNNLHNIAPPSMSSSVSMPSLSSYNQNQGQGFYDTLSPSMLMLGEQLPQSPASNYNRQLQLAPSPVKMERSRTTADTYYEDEIEINRHHHRQQNSLPQNQYIIQQTASHQTLPVGSATDYITPFPSSTTTPNINLNPNHTAVIASKRHSAPSNLAADRARSNSTSSIYSYGGPVFQTPLRRNHILSPSSTTSNNSAGLMTPGSVSSASAWALYNTANRSSQAYSNQSSVSSTPGSAHSNITPMTPGRRHTDFGAGVKLDFSSSKMSLLNSTPNTLNGSPSTNKASPSSATTMVNTPGGINPFYKPSVYIQQQTRQTFSVGSPVSKRQTNSDEEVDEEENDDEQGEEDDDKHNFRRKSSVMASGPPPVMGSLSGSATPTISPTSSASAAAAAAAAALEVQSYSPPLSAAPSLTASEPSSVPSSPDSPGNDHSYTQQQLHSMNREEFQQHQLMTSNYSLMASQQQSQYQFFDTPANILADGTLRLPTHKNPPGRPPKNAIPSKPHRCPDCMKTFRRLEHLKRHAKIHTEERPFNCDVIGCNRKFSRSDNLRAHRKTHMKRGGRNIYIEGLSATTASQQ